jgi:hypothetical protein
MAHQVAASGAALSTLVSIGVGLATTTLGALMLTVGQRYRNARAAKRDLL